MMRIHQAKMSLIGKSPRAKSKENRSVLFSEMFVLGSDRGEQIFGRTNSISVLEMDILRKSV